MSKTLLSLCPLSLSLFLSLSLSLCMSLGLTVSVGVQTTRVQTVRVLGSVSGSCLCGLWVVSGWSRSRLSCCLRSPLIVPLLRLGCSRTAEGGQGHDLDRYCGYQFKSILKPKPCGYLLCIVVFSQYESISHMASEEVKTSRTDEIAKVETR